jgi:hypothetical protein
LFTFILGRADEGAIFKVLPRPSEAPGISDAAVVWQLNAALYQKSGNMQAGQDRKFAERCIDGLDREIRALWQAVLQTGQIKERFDNTHRWLALIDPDPLGKSASEVPLTLVLPIGDIHRGEGKCCLAKGQAQLVFSAVIRTSSPLASLRKR